MSFLYYMGAMFDQFMTVLQVNLLFFYFFVLQLCRLGFVYLLIRLQWIIILELKRI